MDIVFFDGEPQGLRELAWKLQPNTVVTRGAIQTPEQYIPGAPLPGAWEANLTMGTAWQYQPQHEVYKSGPDLIRLLIQTRARGGNLLLNIGPKPDGTLPIEQEERLREIGLWMFVNFEAIYGVRPWALRTRTIFGSPAAATGRLCMPSLTVPGSAEPTSMLCSSQSAQPLRQLSRSLDRTARSTSISQPPTQPPPSASRPTACTSTPCAPSACRTTAHGPTQPSYASPT